MICLIPRSYPSVPQTIVMAYACLVVLRIPSRHSSVPIGRTVFLFRIKLLRATRDELVIPYVSECVWFLHVVYCRIKFWLISSAAGRCQFNEGNPSYRLAAPAVVIVRCIIRWCLLRCILNSLGFVTMTNTGKEVDRGNTRWGCWSYQIVDALVCSRVDLLPGRELPMLLYVTLTP